MANLAEFETTPPGTQRRNSSSSNWINAVPGDTLSDGNESQSTQGNAYQVRLYPEAGVLFNVPTTVSLSNLCGLVKCRTAEGNWAWASNDAQYTTTAVGTGPGGSVSVVCGGQGLLKPKPWS